MRHAAFINYPGAWFAATKEKPLGPRRLKEKSPLSLDDLVSIKMQEVHASYHWRSQFDTEIDHCPSYSRADVVTCPTIEGTGQLIVEEPLLFAPGTSPSEYRNIVAVKW